MSQRLRLYNFKAMGLCCLGVRESGFRPEVMP